MTWPSFHQNSPLSVSEAGAELLGTSGLRMGLGRKASSHWEHGMAYLTPLSARLLSLKLQGSW